MLVGAYVVQTRGALAWEPIAASLPVAVLVALILYVNEIPDRRGDAHAGKRTLPVRLSRAAVIRLYGLAAAAAFASVVVSVALGALPVTALAILLAVPLALRVHEGLAPNYDNPYGLMAIMGVNIRLHLVAGALLLIAYVVVLVAGAIAPDVPLFVR
jgi:1,4-dihydroxy-2-naphthoate octaprenyltransferase